MVTKLEPNPYDANCPTRRALDRIGDKCRLTPLGRTLIEPISSVVRWTEEHIDEVELARARYDDRARSVA